MHKRKRRVVDIDLSLPLPHPCTSLLCHFCPSLIPSMNRAQALRPRSLHTSSRSSSSLHVELEGDVPLIDGIRYWPRGISSQIQHEPHPRLFRKNAVSCFFHESSSTLLSSPLMQYQPQLLNYFFFFLYVERKE